VLAEDSIDSCSIVFLEAWGYCKRRRKLEYILKISNSVVMQGKMTISCYFEAFSSGVAAKKAEIG